MDLWVSARFCDPRESTVYADKEIQRRHGDMPLLLRGLSVTSHRGGSSKGRILSLNGINLLPLRTFRAGNLFESARE